MPDEFKIGDVVQLKSGGPKMTVTFVGKMYESGPLMVGCRWFEGSKQERGEFPPDALLKIA